MLAGGTRHVLREALAETGGGWRRRVRPFDAGGVSAANANDTTGLDVQEKKARMFRKSAAGRCRLCCWCAAFQSGLSLTQCVMARFAPTRLTRRSLSLRATGGRERSPASAVLVAADKRQRGLDQSLAGMAEIRGRPGSFWTCYPPRTCGTRIGACALRATVGDKRSRAARAVVQGGGGAVV